MGADLVFSTESEVDDVCFAPGSSQMHVLMQSGIPAMQLHIPLRWSIKRKLLCNGVFEYRYRSRDRHDLVS